MKIVSKHKFMSMPGRVLYQEVHEGEIQPALYVKNQNCCLGDYEYTGPGCGSWFYTQIDASGQMLDIPVNVGDEFKFEFTGERDSFYEDVVFAVYEPDEIKGLIWALNKVLEPVDDSQLGPLDQRNF